MACTDTQTPHKLSGQSAIHAAWTSKSPTIETIQPPMEASANTKNIHSAGSCNTVHARRGQFTHPNIRLTLS